LTKFLEQNDVINVVSGADNAEPFAARTERNGIDLEFDGSSELFITARYRRYAYTTNLAECDPLLSSLILRCDPYSGGTGGEDDTSTVMDGSEFEDVDKRLYRVTGMDGAMHVLATCFYPRRNNELFGCEKSFNMVLAKELIEKRLNG
jgi:hypothetical protein